MSTEDLCAHCTKEIFNRSASEVVNCFMCNSSHHLNCAVINGFQSCIKNYVWVCNNCFSLKGVLKDVISSISELKEKLNTLQASVNANEVKYANFEQNASIIDQTETEIERDRLGFQEQFHAHERKLEKVVKKQEATDRRQNVVIYGLDVENKSNRTVLDKVKDVFTTILAHNISISRLFVIPNTNIVRVSLPFQHERSLILRNAKLLRNVENYGYVYINPDLTREQRFANKDLRSKLSKVKVQYPKAFIYKNAIVDKNVNGDFVYIYDQPLSHESSPEPVGENRDGEVETNVVAHNFTPNTFRNVNLNNRRSKPNQPF